MENEDGVQAKDMTAKQERLLKDLLDGEELKRAEQRAFGEILESKVSTSHDASVWISTSWVY